MRRLTVLVALLVATGAHAAVPAHYEELAPRGRLQRLWNGLRQLLPPGLRGDLRARARALAADHDRYLADGKLSVGDAILRAARSAPSTVRKLEYRGNKVVGEPLVGGRAIVERMQQLIRGAEREVILQSYIFERSWMADAIKEAIASVPPSVKVRVLVHPRHGYAFGHGPPPIGETTAQARRRLAALLPFDNVEVGVWRVRDAAGTDSLHTKGLVVDGARAIITDTNIQKAVDPIDEGGAGWLQLGLEVEGPIARGLRRDALGAWKRSQPLPRLERLDKAPTDGDARMIVLGKESSSGPRSSANLGYATLFLSARDKVRAITPNLNDSAAVLALAAATAHSDVHLVLSRGFNEAAQWLFQGGGNARNVRRLRALAADPSRLHIRWYTGESGKTTWGNGKDTSHAKWASADGVMILGSQNLDTQSWKKSREVSVAVDDRATTAKFDAEFDRIWARSKVAYEPN